MTPDGAYALLSEAVGLVRIYDGHLFEVCANERSITHRLAIHIEALLRGAGDDYDVDCEYNRNHDDPKEIPWIAEAIGSDEVSVEDLDARTVYPDIIVHRRGSGVNLLAIEVKKRGRKVSNGYDRTKLQGYLAGLGYHVVAFIEFPVGPGHAEEEPCIVVSTPDREVPEF